MGKSIAAPLGLAAASALLASAVAAAPPRTGRPAPAPTPAAALDAARLKPLAARSIGPAVMGGRVPDVAFDPRDPFTFYVALGTGGLMKTTDNGATFEGVFEDEP